MRIVALVPEGIEIARQLKKYDKVSCRGLFGRLTFEIDLSQMSVQTTNDLIDELNEIDNVISCYANEHHTLEFDYYVTSDLLPEIRGIIDLFIHPNGMLLYWVFDDTIQELI